jgi:hypothetical protein
MTTLTMIKHAGPDTKWTPAAGGQHRIARQSV